MHIINVILKFLKSNVPCNFFKVLLTLQSLDLIVRLSLIINFYIEILCISLEFHNYTQILPLHSPLLDDDINNIAR